MQKVSSVALFHNTFALMNKTGNTKGGCITVPLTSCLIGLDQSVLQIKTKHFSCRTADSKPVKQEVNSTVIHPPVTFPEQDCVFEHCKKVKNNKENIYLLLKSSSVYLFSATLYMLIFVLFIDMLFQYNLQRLNQPFLPLLKAILTEL